MKFIVGNWKMHGDRALAESLAAASKGSKHTVVLCPPYTLLHHVKGIALGAQDCSAEPKGAFTGDISASMLKDAGCEWVILGHSERRQNHGEDDALIARKVKSALAAGLKVILCVGETQAEREAGEAEAIVKKQLSALPESCLIAYEPVWAIGSGLVPSSEQIEAIHRCIKETFEKINPSPLEGEGGVRGASSHKGDPSPDPSLKGRGVRVLYGGSVKPENIAEILAIPGVDGVLVGGASIEPAAWAKIVQA